MARIFWDANIFIYLVEGSGAEAERVRSIWLKMRERRDELHTSALTIAEILVKPFREGRDDLAQTYRALLGPPTVTVIAFDQAAAVEHAALRIRRVKPADAIQLACAAAARVDLFVTNDEQLARISSPGIPFIATLQRTPL